MCLCKGKGHVIALATGFAFGLASDYSQNPWPNCLHSELATVDRLNLPPTIISILLTVLTESGTADIAIRLPRHQLGRKRGHSR
jgi:hypothetical protein